MMTHETAFELSRQHLEFVQRRATLSARLGSLPEGRPLFPFRRQRAVPLTGTIEVRHFGADKERIRRRLDTLTTSQRKAS